ncbi:hypothetical protein CGU03_08700 [Vibrio metoecus]|uniref:Uncharacterized protein n=1 Tax=Vibrio metoecus TaxID=1481663 RepID=A0A271VUI9_VIBMT|nr:hypothetical protein CGU03_08700 [Vibrio metoecus]PAR24004.1 hypothetical protein CGU02_12055 [Vibrio metoecus]
MTRNVEQHLIKRAHSTDLSHKIKAKIEEKRCNKLHLFFTYVHMYFKLLNLKRQHQNFRATLVVI